MSLCISEGCIFKNQNNRNVAFLIFLEPSVEFLLKPRSSLGFPSPSVWVLVPSLFLRSEVVDVLWARSAWGLGGGRGLDMGQGGRGALAHVLGWFECPSGVEGGLRCPAGTTTPGRD